MGRIPGDGRGRLGGRAPGTPNKESESAAELCRKLKVSPFQILLHFAAGDWKALGYQSESYVEDGKGYSNQVLYIQPEVRMTAASRACEYIHPKRKSLEVIEIPAEAPPAVRTFQEFCDVAGYPAPYPKQIEMMSFGLKNVEPRLLLGSRGYGKTDYITVLGLAYDVYLNGPETSNLIITKSASRNTSIMNEIANALTKNKVDLEKQNASCVRIPGLIGKDHSVEAITIKTSMRGRHPKRVVMDDPVTEEDVSEAMRKIVKRKYNEVMKLCSNVLVIGQPAHKYDLYAELSPMVKKMEVPYGSIPELDPDLQAQRLAGVDEASIQASYFLKITSDSATPFEKIRYLDAFPTGESSVAFIDPSFEGGDYTAVSIVKAHMQGVAVVGFAYKKAWNHCVDEIYEKLKKYSVKMLCFETNGLGTQPLDILRKSFDNIVVSGRKSNSNKHSRIVSAGTFSHMIHLSKESDRIYIDQVTKYEYKAKHDDCPDSLASCLEWIGYVRGKQ